MHCQSKISTNEGGPSLSPRYAKTFQSMLCFLHIIYFGNSKTFKSQNVSVLFLEDAVRQFSLLPDGGNLIINEMDPLKVECVIDRNLYESAVLTKDGSILVTVDKKLLDESVLTYAQLSGQIAHGGRYQCKALLKRGGTRIRVLDVIVKSKCIPPLSVYVFPNLSKNRNNYDLALRESQNTHLSGKYLLSEYCKLLIQ